MKRIIIFTLLVATFVVYGQKSKGWRTFETDEFSIQYPNNFELNTSGLIGTKFVLFSEQTSDKDLFRENVNLVSQNISGQNIDLDKFVEISKKQLEIMIPNGKLIESKRISNENKEFQRFIFSGTQGQSNLKWLQYFFIKNDKVYVLTLTCEINQYDKYVSVGEDIMKTFVIK